MLAFAAAVVLSQAVYSWVDEQGVTHYTDGASGVPETAEKTELEPVTVIPAAPENLVKPEPKIPGSTAAEIPGSKPVERPAPVVHAQPTHTEHNILPQFTYVKDWPEHEGTGLYYRWDPAPPCPPHQHRVQRTKPAPAPAPAPVVEQPVKPKRKVTYGSAAPLSGR
jgi:hypothetical protein